MTLSRCLTVRVFAVLLLMAFLSAHLGAQSTDARVTGIVTDPSKAVIRGAKVVAINTDTGGRYPGITNSSGIYSLSAVPAGRYRIEVENRGFKSVVMPGVTLHIQDVDEINFEMALGSMSETVTVNGDSVQMNTSDASVSTVIDQKLISELPMNGRSLDSLFLLTPGVVSTGTQNAGGQYSVNGQRSSGNNLTVDGASGNVYESAIASSQRGQAGSTYATSASGGTNGLLPVDAIEEYRIQTSTYSAEFGRSPGGQIQMRTRSGGNQFHGSVFEYFRNQVMDATDWFVKYNRLKQAALRMNDFGGTLGGPILKNRLFFFAAHETLDLDQPGSQSSGVPSALAKQSVSSSFAPFLAAYPNGNGGPSTTSKYPTYTDIYNAAYATKVIDHSTSVRLDASLPRGFKTFFRFNIAPSSSSTTIWSSTAGTINLNTYTAGVTKTITPSMLDELTFNFTTNNGHSTYTQLPIGGAEPTGFNQFCNVIATGLKPIQCTAATLSGWANLDGGTINSSDLQQFNMVDTFRWQIRKHSIAVGADYRRLSTSILPSTTDTVALSALSGPTSLAGSTFDEVLTSSTNNSQTIPATNLSIFAQDDWHVTSRLTVNYGLRWEYNPPVSDGHGGPLAITGDINNFASLQPAPAYTPLYKTTHANFAPRLGIAYQLRQDPQYATVVRLGGGIFYDTGQAASTVGSVLNAYPYTISASQLKVPISQLNFQALQQGAARQSLPSSGGFYTVNPNLVLPYTGEWNVALEQQLFGKATISATYLGADGEKLAVTSRIYGLTPALVTPTGSFFLLTNGGRSNYQALQLQSTIRSSQLDGVIAYTYSHNIDNGTSDFSGPLPYSPNYRSNADDDVRQAFAAGISYRPKGVREQPILRAITSGWVFNTFTHLQTALPLSVTLSSIDTGLTAVQVNTITGFADLVPGVSVYLRQSIGSNGKMIPGGIQLNPAAFTYPPKSSTGALLRDGDSGRNKYRLFGLKEFDFSMGRKFVITERFGLEFKAEAFNILNTASFANVSTQLGGANFGQAQNTAAGFAGSGGGGGGLNTVFQSGGPRNVQLTARLSF